MWHKQPVICWAPGPAPLTHLNRPHNLHYPAPSPRLACTSTLKNPLPKSHKLCKLTHKHLILQPHKGSHKSSPLVCLLLAACYCCILPTARFLSPLFCILSVRVPLASDVSSTSSLPVLNIYTSLSMGHHQLPPIHPSVIISMEKTTLRSLPATPPPLFLAQPTMRSQDRRSGPCAPALCSPGLGGPPASDPSGTLGSDSLPKRKSPIAGMLSPCPVPPGDIPGP